MATRSPVGLQEMPLLRTKLYTPPLRHDQVPRSHLVERLRAGLHRKLALISAPAGFGKTTLVSEWVHAMGKTTPPIAVAWLSLDESDNDPARFLTYLIAALQGVETQQEADGPIGSGLLGALQSAQPPPAEAVLTALINEIADLSERIVLVLDDYHLIDAQPIHDALTFLLRRLPPQLHLVIATREDPPLPLARLRARGQLAELRATDLRFTPSEAAEFLNQAMGLDLSAEDIAALESRTEGWVAGLQLAAISMQGRKDVTGFVQSFAGSHHFVLDYLVEEVLEQQPASVQAFLLQTSVLDRLTGSLCDALTGQENGQQALEMLQHANLFIVPLDDERHWYRYHHLFADLLRQQLRQAQPERLPTLHQRAIEWYEEHGFPDEAIEHAFRAEDFERAARLVESVAEATWGHSSHYKLRRWLAELPVELLSTRPHLCVFHAGYLFASGEQDAAEQSLQAAEHALARTGDVWAETSLVEQDPLSHTDTTKLLGRIAATRSFMASYRSDARGVIPHARQALQYLPQDDLAWRGAAAVALGDAYIYRGQYVEAHRTYLEALEAIGATGNTYLYLNVSLKMALGLKSQGRLQRAIEICQQRLQLAQQSGMSGTEMVGWLLAIWGEVLAELGDLDGALCQAKKGVALTEQGSDVAMLTWSYMCLTRVLFSRGNLDAAHEIITATERIAQASVVPRWVTNLMGAWRVRIWLAQDKLDETLEWMRKRWLDLNAQTTYVDALDNVALARVFMAQKRYEDAVRLLERLLEPAEAGAHITRAVQILILQALALQAQGDTDQAMAPLERALALAQPGGYVRIFADEGPSMARLLYEALARGTRPDYVRRLLAAFPVTAAEPPTSSVADHPSSTLIEPLSERELEVLELIAQGLTNPEIASRLYLALNTVKAHTSNIYGKLGVHNRTEAAARARALGLLPST